MVCTVQIQPKKLGLGHADFAASTGQHEVDHADREYTCPKRHKSCALKGIDDLSEM